MNDAARRGQKLDERCKELPGFKTTATSSLAICKWPLAEPISVMAGTCLEQPVLLNAFVLRKDSSPAASSSWASTAEPIPA